MPRKTPSKKPQDAKFKPPLGQQRKRKVKEDIKSKITNKRAKAVVSDSPSTSQSKTDQTRMKKMTFTGVVPVDDHCTLSGYHVYIDKRNVSKYNMYNVMLNQTNVGENNNKYYVLQVLQHDKKLEYATWMRWGRVGKVAGTTLNIHGGDLGAAIKLYESKFREKTGNWWSQISAPWQTPFKKKAGKYDMLEMDYGKDGGDEKDVKEKFLSSDKDMAPSALDPRVQEVIDLIFNIDEFEACVKEMQFDVKKAPLGKLTTSQIKAGYEALKKIEKCIEDKNLQSKALVDACSEFYTRIPHDFGMKRPPLITTSEQLKQKIELLETLSDIQIAIQVINDDFNGKNMNVKDRHYESLKCSLEPCDSNDKEFKMVKKFITNSHGIKNRWFLMNLDQVYKVEREGDSSRFKEKIGNKKLLWHGSRLTNWCGILKQGLRIAPPEAPACGYMFGKGVYFADTALKSGGYCRASKRQPYGFLLLCEVALGDMNEKKYPDRNASCLPKGKSSTKGMGSEFPDPKSDVTLNCGTVASLGRIKMGKKKDDYYLAHNEYIVYDVAQIRARYLVKVKFDFNW